MNKHKLCGFAMLTICCLFSAILLGRTVSVYATDMYNNADDPAIILSGYEISGEKIVPGEKFDMILKLQNSSQTRRAESVMVTITNPSGVVPAYSTVSQLFLGNFAAGEEQDITVTYVASKNLYTESLTFGITITSSSNSNFVYLTAPVEIDNSPFRVLNQSVPEKAKAGERVTASIYFKTNSVDNFSNMVMVASLGGNKIATSNIGNMTSGASKTQDVSFVVYDEGLYKLNLYLEYVDEFGSEEKFILYDGEITIDARQEEIQPPVEEPSISLAGFSADQLRIMILCAGAILVLGAATILLLCKYNR